MSKYYTEKEFYVYIMMNCRNTVIYTGMTDSLYRRVLEHKNKINPKSFTARYNVEKLVYFEVFDNAYDAIGREKVIKGWVRKKKIELIRSINPEFKDLYKTSF